MIEWEMGAGSVGEPGRRLGGGKVSAPVSEGSRGPERA